MKCKNSYLQKISKNGTYSRYYIERFMGMSCAVDLLSHKMYPNAKEITESFGCFEAVVNNLPYDRDDKVNVVCVGDGHSPRTAAMFAFRSPWDTYSIDPVLRQKGHWKQIKRLETINKRIQDVNLTFKDPTVIVHCHAHVKIEDSLKSISAPKISVISMECCVAQFIDKRKPDLEYTDHAVWTPCNRIKIWI
jgi:hypothetical protein